jgi:hypothetical protein
MRRQTEFSSLRPCLVPRLVFTLSFWVCSLTAFSFSGGPEAAAASFPISVRLEGKLFLVPTGDSGRHRDLLPLGLNDHQVVYLQVDSFHTSNKEQGELTLFSDMQRYKPHLRVINSDMLAALLTEETLRGKRVAIHGFLYRTTGLLLIAAAHVKE